MSLLCATCSSALESAGKLAHPPLRANCAPRIELDLAERAFSDLRAREIATISELTAMGNAAPQIKVHIEAGLNVGLSRDEITEIIMQMAVYVGFQRR